MPVLPALTSYQAILTDKAIGETGLLLGTTRLNMPLSVRPTRTRRELGNLLVVAPTRGGKGLLATAQLLTWQHSIVVNDIKGELFQQTAGYRSTLGPVFCLDPKGVGHSYDPLTGKTTEDELFSAATHLLFKPDEGDGAIFTQRATVMLTQLLDAVYGKTRAQILRDNMESQIYYRPPNQQTADYLEHCLGRCSAYAHSQITREGTRASLGFSEQPVPLMTAQLIKQLKDEEIIGFHRRLPAFRARRMDWRHFPTLIQRRRIPPPQLPILPAPQHHPLQSITQPASEYIDPDNIN